MYHVSFMCSTLCGAAVSHRGVRGLRPDTRDKIRAAVLAPLGVLQLAFSTVAVARQVLKDTAGHTEGGLLADVSRNLSKELRTKFSWLFWLFGLVPSSGSTGSSMAAARGAAPALVVI